MTKAPLGGKTGRNPTDRGKFGVKRSVLTDAVGIPIGIAVAGANVHDQTLIKATFQSISVRRPKPSLRRKQHFCADKGYDAQSVRRFAKRRGYVVHMPIKGEPSSTRRRRGAKARRWVVERTHSWINRARRLLIRWEKKAANYLGLLQIQFAITTFKAAGALG